jgi:agmatine deiminase
MSGEGVEILPIPIDAYPGREIVTVPGATILEGGGGPHCITQQIPAGAPLA